jgi:hypothetical protein
MPRGVPRAGYRKPRQSKMDKTAQLAKIMNVQAPAEPVVVETDEEIEQKLNDRFEVLADMTEAATDGAVRSMIVSGPGGLGKSYTVERVLNSWDPNAVNHTVIRGFVKVTGLFKLLYQNRAPGQVLVFDDADSVFLDDVSVNLLKAVCDSTEKRIVSYMSEGVLIDDESAERLPKSFEFEGTIIFITNMDFDGMIDRGSKLAPHLEAMLTRSHYIDLAMKTRRDYIIRIKQVVAAGILRGRGLDAEAETDVMEFIDENQDCLRELSLRMAIKLADIRKRNSKTWKKTARVTCCK